MKTPICTCEAIMSNRLPYLQFNEFNVGDEGTSNADYKIKN